MLIILNLRRCTSHINTFWILINGQFRASHGDTLRPEIYPELRKTAPINYQYYKEYDCCSKFHCTRRNGISGFSLPMTRYVDQIAENEGWETKPVHRRKTNY